MASMTTPSSLATFDYSHASSSRVPHITLGGVHGSKGKLAVAAVHGDGVWTYDIKTLRPVATFTVPPSTVFACAPVSFIPAADESDNENESAPERVTAVGVHAGEGVKDGRAVWVWRGDEGSRAPVSLPFPVHSVHAVRGGWPLLAVGTNGALAAISSSLQTTSLLQPRPKAVRVLAAGVVDAHAALAPRAVIVDDRGRAYVYALEASSVNAVAEGALAGPQLLAADVGPDGTISVIDATHRVHARTVASIVESATSSTSAAPAGVLLTHAATPAAIISLPSASRPLAAIATAHPSPAVALALPSPDLPAVLASVPISTAASTAITHLSVLSRNEADNTLVLGTVLAHPDQAADGAGRSVIHLVDVALPAGGVGLSLLVGSAARTAAVFKVGGAVHQNAGDRMVEAVAAALRASDAARAEKAFATWLEGEDKAAAGRQALIPESVGRKTLQAVFAAALTDGKKTGPYATKIVQTLVDRRAVTDSMWDGGVLLAGLVPAGDWRNVSHFVRKSQSLPSSTAVGLLAHSLSTDEPALTSALDDIVSGPSPDPAYRAALRRGIDGAGALRVLSLLVEWAEAGSAVSDGLDVWPERAPRTATPALASVIAHASALLDAHLPSLIPMPDAEPLLLRLQEALAPALAAQADYRRLRAPVDAALRLAKPEKKEATAAAATQHGRKSAARVESKTPGLTEEAVGKYRVEDIVF